MGIPALDRRGQLAAVAYDVVAEAGLEGLSLRTVARRVGATTGLVSHHFADRRDLLEAALAHAAATMFDRVRDLAADVDPLVVLAAVLPTDDASRRVWRFSLSVRVAGLFDPEVRRFDEAIRAHWDDHLPARLTTVAPRARRDAARHLVAVVDGIALSAVLDPDGWPAARQHRHLEAGFAALGTGVFGSRR